MVVIEGNSDKGSWIQKQLTSVLSVLSIMCYYEVHSDWLTF